MRDPRKSPLQSGDRRESPQDGRPAEPTGGRVSTKTKAPLSADALIQESALAPLRRRVALGEDLGQAPISKCAEERISG